MFNANPNVGLMDPLSNITQVFFVLFRKLLLEEHKKIQDFQWYQVVRRPKYDNKPF